ncbi:MAG: hypothetical protein BGO01_10790 [Armatimonadetes bacterium 55-13]|nr:rhomboid family intramembrane serine protease [Armatimonadota bacterium]OJU62879.1 MAG: hypothetical protein BGO01_10790 [Armatimonadetes bacterium 55-13]
MIEKSRLPIVTLLLIAANLFAAFAVAISAQGSLGAEPEMVTAFGFNPQKPNLLTAFTNLFLHQNLLHLLGNMVFLAAVGAAVELATGSARFATVYFVSGLMGVVAHYIFTRSLSQAPILVGASGCVAGCAAYYSVRYTHLKVPVAPKRGLSVAMVTGVWLALQFVGAFVHIGESAAVSFWAHIGGVLGGLLLSAIFRAPDLGQARLGHAVLDQMNERGPAAVALAARQHLKEHPNDIRALRQLAEAERQLAHPAAEVSALVKLLEILPESEQPDPIRRLDELEKLATLPCLRRTLLADRFRESEPTVARLLLVSVIEGVQDDPQVPEAMLALASMELPENPDKAQEILTRLQDRYPLHPTVELAKHRGWLS